MRAEQDPLRVVAARVWLAHHGLTLGEQACYQHARLDLCARDGQLVVDAGQPAAADLERREPALTRLYGGAHPRQRLDDAIYRPLANRLVAGEGPDPASMPGQPPWQ